jgi:hypothetical protein
MKKLKLGKPKKIILKPSAKNSWPYYADVKKLASK